MSALLERLGVERPVVQAGMGGGIAGPELAAAVSEAGGLGTLGFAPVDDIRRAIAAARERTSAPVAANVLLPLARREHLEAAASADALVTFWGRPERRSEGVWLHQCGSVREALAAQRAGADGVIAQGMEAGGHVRGEAPALELLARVRRELPPGYPVLLAGGIADAADVRAALDAGADAAVLGTRFVMTDESGAHPAYKQRLMEARETVLTELFGLGWPRAPHRVLWNEATERWLRGDPRGPRAVRALHSLITPLAHRLPEARQMAMAATQQAGVPLFGPVPPSAQGPSNLLDAGPLYAGETVARLHDIRPAGPLVRELAG